jgi:hypothetical protein
MATVPVRTGPLAVVERQLDALSPRDRKLLAVLVLFFVGVATLVFWWMLHSQLESKASRVRDAKETLAAVQELDAEYQSAASQFAAEKGRLEEYANQPVTAWVEELTKKHGLETALSAVRQQSAQEVGDIVQTRYTVELKKAAQEPLYRFLYDLETSAFPARVEQATFKTATVKKERVMDLTLELVVLSVGEG